MFISASSAASGVRSVWPPTALTSFSSWFSSKGTDRIVSRFSSLEPLQFHFWCSSCSPFGSYWLDEGDRVAWQAPSRSTFLLLNCEGLEQKPEMRACSGRMPMGRTVLHCLRSITMCCCVQIRLDHSVYDLKHMFKSFTRVSRHSLRCTHAPSPGGSRVVLLFLGKGCETPLLFSAVFLVFFSVAPVAAWCLRPQTTCGPKEAEHVPRDRVSLNFNPCFIPNQEAICVPFEMEN